MIKKACFIPRDKKLYDLTEVGNYFANGILVHNCDTELYKPSYESKEDFILYVGAPRKEKGIFTILDIAGRLPKENFVLAWKAWTDEHRRTEREFLGELERRRLTNVEFRELPERNQARAKIELYQKAKGFLQPTSLSYVEAFGLTSCESLACATPVIREGHGSAPELVEHGITGFLCNDIGEYVRAIREIERIDPGACREYAVKHHSRQRMTEDFLGLRSLIGW